MNEKKEKINPKYFIILLVSLDALTTFYGLQILKMPLEIETNLVARFIYQEHLWKWVLAYTLMVISAWIVIFDFHTWYNKKYVKNRFIPIITSSLIYTVLTYPIVNNLIVIFSYLFQL